MTGKELIINNKSIEGKQIIDSKPAIEGGPDDNNRDVNQKETRKKYIKYLGELLPVSEFIKDEGLSETELTQAVVKIYEKSSKKITKERTKIYQKNLKVTPKSITIEKNRKRWGSCNTKKEITYHYLIVTLPIELIDYIVIHELCHLHHMNHDRSFWRKVGSIIPDYKLKIKLLEEIERGC